MSMRLTAENPSIVHWTPNCATPYYGLMSTIKGEMFPVVAAASRRCGAARERRDAAATAYLTGVLGITAMAGG